MSKRKESKRKMQHFARWWWQYALADCECNIEHFTWYIGTYDIHFCSYTQYIPNCFEWMLEWVYVLYRLAKWNTNRIEKWNKSPSKKNAKPNIRENKKWRTNKHAHKKMVQKECLHSVFFVFASIKKPSNTFCQWTMHFVSLNF